MVRVHSKRRMSSKRRMGRAIAKPIIQQSACGVN